MNRILFCVIVIIFCVAAKGFGQEKLARLKLEKEVEVKVPVSFTPLTAEEIVSRYLSNSTPLVVYGNERRTADFGISKNPTRWTAGDSEILKDFYKASILTAYTDVVFSKEEVTEIGDQRYILFEFVSYFKEENNNSLVGSSSVSKYTYIMYGLRNGSLYVFNFSAPAKEKTYWQGTVDKMMQSIKFL
ncbi:MAG: hypothetical protein WBA74_10035 [Cyclobacteriaceae bacterium]